MHETEPTQQAKPGPNTTTQQDQAPADGSSESTGTLLAEPGQRVSPLPRGITPATDQAAAAASTQSEGPHTDRSQEFLAMVTRPVREAPATPASRPQRKRAVSVATTLRRSRRIANSVGPTNTVQKAQTVLMRKLGIIDTQQPMSQEAREAYARLFEHPLSPSHIAALAALFGWTVPDSGILVQP